MLNRYPFLSCSFLSTSKIRVWLKASNPTKITNVLGSDGIRRTSISAADTLEPTPFRTVLLVNTAAFSTSSGSVPGIDQDHRNSTSSSLVLNEAPQLVEAPRVMLTPLSLSHSYSLRDSSKVFQSNGTESVLGFRHHLLRGAVIHVSTKSGLFTSPLSEEPFC